MLCNQSGLCIIFPLGVSKLCLCCCPESGCRDALPGKRPLINARTLHKQYREDSPSPLGLSVYPTEGYAVSSQFVGLKSLSIEKPFFVLAVSTSKCAFNSEVIVKFPKGRYVAFFILLYGCKGKPNLMGFFN